MKDIENIADRRELFVDHAILARMDRVSLKLHEPVSGGVAIKIAKPWEGPANFGICVIQVDGEYLMYYRSWSLKSKGDDYGVGCVAVSRDGVTWTKPALNLVRKPEWLDNNIIATDAGVPEFSFPCAPWVDTRPGVPANERIKVVRSVGAASGEKSTAMLDPSDHTKRLVFWASRDGRVFHKLNPQPEMVSDLPNCFDGSVTMFWSEAEQQYVVYYRFWDGDYPGMTSGYRSIARATSKDLMRWTKSVPMTCGNSQREHLYVNNTQPYFRAPHIYIAPAARFMFERRAVTTAKAEAFGLLNAIGSFKYDWSGDCSDGVLLTSRAGTTVYNRTFQETFVRPGPGAENWTSRSNYPLTGILPFGKDRMMLFVARRFMQPDWHIERLLLRVDGFASVNAPWAGGEMLTKPFTFTGKELEINYRTGAPGFVRVEIQDADGKAIPGYALSDCPEIIGDEITRVVAWKSGADVARFAGQPVRLRFAMKDADLYSFRFRNETTISPSKAIDSDKE